MNVKKLYRKLLNLSVKNFGVEFTKKSDALIRFHRKLNLKNPSTLADKLCYLELNIDNPLKTTCSDKYEVRNYVASKGLSDILVPLCYPVCSNVDEIDFYALPNQFAMKATHGCEMNLICENKSLLDKEETLKTAKKWLNEDYSRTCIEPHYKTIPHRIIFENFLQDSDSIIDYKFHCFHGIPDFVLVCSNRASGLKLCTYTLDWKSLDILKGNKSGTQKIEKPKTLEQMIEICKILSSDFDFVRVDLYEINGKIYFGELTFSPGAGVLYYFNEEFIYEKGKLLNIDIK